MCKVFPNVDDTRRVIVDIDSYFMQYVKKSTLLLNIVLLALSVLGNSAFAADDFPGRTHKKYKNAPYIEIYDLIRKFNDVVVVDARSKFEYDTLRIKNALNIPVALDSFEQNVKDLRKKTSKTLVFYCNGHTCMKSYQSVLRAKAAGVDNVVAFDAGIFDWAKRYPDKAVLLGKSPINVKRLISKENLHRHMLDPDTFSDRATRDAKKSAIIDIRDKFQRAGVGFYPGMERWASLNDMKKLRKRIQLAQDRKQSIYIYDEVGKQVRWLQYALEEMGVKDYHFMSKGAKGYYHMISASLKINK